MTDFHCGYAAGGLSPRNFVPMRAVIDTLGTLANFKGLIFGGDYSETAAEETQEFADTLAAILSTGDWPKYPVIGNWEALRSDTLAHGDPYVTARARFSGYFGGLDYYAFDINNAHFVVLQNNANFDTTATSDYRQNNPVNFSGAGQAINDFDGITIPGSPQRLFLTADLAARDRSHWYFTIAHRPTDGNNAFATRLNFWSAWNATGYLTEIQAALISGENCVGLFGDQHVPLWLTKAFSDSAVIATTGGGIYSLIVSSGAGARSADTTSIVANGLQSFLYQDGSAGLDGRTSTAWADTITVADAGAVHAFTWALLTVYGDDMLIEVFRTWTTESAGHAQYTGAGSHRLVDRRTLHRDN